MAAFPGVGEPLIAAAEKDFGRRNVTRVTLTTRFERSEARRFYERSAIREPIIGLQKI